MLTGGLRRHITGNVCVLFQETFQSVTKYSKYLDQSWRLHYRLQISSSAARFLQKIWNIFLSLLNIYDIDNMSSVHCKTDPGGDFPIAKFNFWCHFQHDTRPGSTWHLAAWHQWTACNFQHHECLHHCALLHTFCTLVHPPPVILPTFNVLHLISCHLTSMKG